MRRVADKIRIPAALFTLWGTAVLTAGNAAAVLRNITSSGSEVGTVDENVDMLGVINGLLDEALVITIVIAPLAICWGAGMLMFSTRGGGGQIMGSAIVAVVLVFAAKGIAA